MTGQMKQRIVGIVVLIFLALIILPWLLSSNQSNTLKEHKLPETDQLVAESSGETPSSKPEPDSVQESLTPSVSDKPVPEPSLIAESLPSPSTEQKADKAETTLPSANIVSIENGIVNSNGHAVKGQAKANAKVAKIAPKPVITRKANADKSPIIASKKLVNDRPIEKGWMIQLGTFSNKDNAQKLVSNLKAKNYPVHVKKIKNAAGDEIIRVTVGPHLTKQAADQTVTKIDKSLHIHGVVVKSSI